MSSGELIGNATKLDLSSIRPFSMEFYQNLYFISCHTSIFDDIATLLRRERRNGFDGIETLLTRLLTSYKS